MSAVATYSYTQSVAYVADNILKSFKEIIRASGLDPSDFADDWPSNLLAVRTWLESGHLERVMLEIYHPDTNKLIYRWDLDIAYGWGSGDGSFWTDVEQLKYAIAKAGVTPSAAKYKFAVTNKLGRPDVPGWGMITLRSTEGMIKQSLGSTVEHSGLVASAGYWRPR
jgi:Bacterial HORMA domain 2